jgi:RTX calcium-binding nonapeptide repeat (4 copies)
MGVAAAAALALPASASAAVTCSFNPGTGALAVTVTNGTNTAAIGRAASPATDVLIDDSFDLSSPLACAGGTPTLSTTSQIAVDESGSSQGTTLRLNFKNGRLEPGLDAETGTPEIEVTYTADATGTDGVTIDGATENADQFFRFGAVAGPAVAGNLNADDDADDITATGAEVLTAGPGTGNDTFTGDGSGSASFTGPVPTVMRANPSQGNDVFAAGTGSNNIFTGGLGNDTLTGGSNTDTLDMADGNDTFDGGGGIDYASYESDPSATGVTLDLSQPGPQNTGDQGIDQVSNVENAVGSNGGDHLTGSGAANTLFGGNISNDVGDDVLIGGGGDDDLIGWKGNDTLIGGQGNDHLEGDAGTDTASFAVGSTGPVTFSLDQALTGAPQVTGGASSDTLDDGVPTGDSNHEIENLVGSPFAGDNLTGNGQANRIDAYDGLADTVDCVAAGDGDVAIADEVGVDSPANCETVDNAPQTSIASGPADGATVATAAPTYALSADEPATFQVKVDSGSFQACPASCAVPSLANGAHSLAFRAVDADENGNADLTPATRTVMVSVPTPPDTIAPDTAIGSHPKPKTRKRTATFTFSSTEPGSTFLCSYDGKPYAPCAGSFTTPKLKLGKHRLDIVATDVAGNRDPTPVEFLWKIVKRRKH